MDNENTLPPLSEVVDAGAAAGYSPAAQAQAVLNWRNDARSTLDESGFSKENPQGFFRGNTALDADISSTLRTLQQQDVIGWASKTFGNANEANAFLATFKKDPEAAAQVNAGAATELGGILSNPVYQAPRQVDQYFPLRVGNQQIGNYAVQQGAHGGNDVLINVSGEDGKGQSTILRVPTVTDEDVTTAVKAAQAKAQEMGAKAKENQKLADAALNASGDPEGAFGAILPTFAQKSNLNEVRDAELRATQLSGPQGKAILQQERINEAFKKSPLGEKQGEFGPLTLLQDAMRGAVSMELGINAAIQDLTGTEKAQTEAREALAALPDVIPGTTKETGTAKFLKGGFEMGGQLPMLLNPGGVAILAASTYGGSVAGARDAADAADEQAKQIEAQNPKLAAEFRNMANEMRRDARAYGALSGGTMALAGRLMPEANSLLGRTARSAGEWATINATQGQLLNPLLTGRRNDPADILEGILMGGITGAIHGVISRKPKAAGEAGTEAAAETPPVTGKADPNANLVTQGNLGAKPPETPPAAAVPPVAQAPAPPAPAPTAPAAGKAPPQPAITTAPLPPPPSAPPPEPRRESLQDLRNRRVETLKGENPSPEIEKQAAAIQPVQEAKDLAIANGDAEAAKILQQVEDGQHDKLAAAALLEAATKPATEPTNEEAQKGKEGEDTTRGPGSNPNPDEALTPPAPVEPITATPAEQPAEPGTPVVEPVAPVEPPAPPAPPAAAPPAAVEPTPPPVEQPKVEPRSFKRGAPVVYQHFIDNPVIKFIVEKGGLLGKKNAQKRTSDYSGERTAYEDYPAQWDGQPSLQNSSHNTIFGGAERPNQMAESLHRAGLIADGHPDTMWEAIRAASVSAMEQAKEGKRLAEAERTEGGTPTERKQAGNFYEDGLKPQPGDFEVPPEDLSVGDVVTVNGEPMKVTEAHPDGGVTLEDGKRFGIQKVEAGQIIYAEDVAEQNAFLPADEKFSKVPTNEGPKLQPGQSEAPLLEEAAMPFNLVSETPADKTAREERERVAELKKTEAERAAAAAQAEKDQTSIDFEKPPAPEASRTKREPEVGKEPPEKPPVPEAGVPPGPDQIRLAHADETARRVAEGKEPIEVVPQGTVEEWDTLAQQKVANGQGPALVASLLEKPRVATPVEDYMMKHYAENLERTRAEADRTLADPKAPEAAKADAADKKAFADNERERLALAANQAGSAWGAAGNARGRAKNRDEIPSFPQMIADAMTAKGKAQGKTFLDLSPEERAAIEERYKRIAEIQAQQAAKGVEATVKANKELLDQVRKELDQTKADLAALQAKVDKGQRPRFTKRVVNAISEKAEAARQRLRDRGISFNTGIDPTLIPDYAIIMAEYIAKGADAAAEMLGKFGAGIKDSLRDIEKVARGLLEKEIAPKTVDEIKDTLRNRREDDPEETIGKTMANELAKAHIREAMENGQDLTPAELDSLVHQDLQEFELDITLVEARDLRTGYGKQRFPSDDPVDVKLRELNRASQLVSSIERAEKEKPPLKSGGVRDKASALIRDLTKKLHAVMAKMGIETRSPEVQLATRRDAIRSRLTNEIEDLDNIIAGKQKEIAKNTNFDYNHPDNADLKKLLDHRNALKKIVDAMPENVEASNKVKNANALKAAQDAEKEWTRRANELDFSNRANRTPERTQEVKDARRKADEARSRYNDLKKAEKAHQPALYFQDIANQVKATEKRIADLETKLNTGDLSVETAKEKPSHPLLDAARTKLDSLTKELEKRRADAEKPAKEAEKLRNRLDDAQAKVVELEAKLASGDLSKSPSIRRAVTAELQAARDQVKGLQKGIQKARNDAEKPKRAAEAAARELENAKKAVAKLEAKLASGDLSKKATTLRTVPGELAAERAKLKALNKELAKARHAAKPKVPEEAKRREAFKARVKKKIAELRMRRVAEDFETKRRKTADISHDKESTQLAVALAKELQGFEEDKRQYEQRARSAFRKIADFAVHWAREFKLMHPTTVEKLTGAGIENIATRPIGTALAQIMRPLPVLRDVRRRATYEGRASAKSELRGLQSTFASAKAVWQKATKGKSDIDWLYKSEHYSEENKSYFGRIHGAIKEPVRQGIYSRSLQLELEIAQEAYAKTGDVNLDPNQNPLLRQALGARAFENANRDIMMGDNFLTKGVRVMLASLRNNKIDADAGKVIADLLEIVMPIINVPTNIFLRVQRLNPVIGFGDAARRLIRAARKGELANGAEKLSANEADAITRSFKYGLMGVALAAYAWNNPQYFGGYWTTGSRRKESDLAYGDIQTPHVSINHHFAHGPVGTFLNIVADSRREYDKFLKKNPHSNGEAAVSAFAFSILAPVQRLPFIESFLRFFDPSKSAAQHAAEIARGSFLPADVDLAKHFDKDEHGNPVNRKASTPLQEIQLGIPGMRNKLPETKGSKKKRNDFNPLK